MMATNLTIKKDLAGISSHKARDCQPCLTSEDIWIPSRHPCLPLQEHLAPRFNYIIRCMHVLHRHMCIATHVMLLSYFVVVLRLSLLCSPSCPGIHCIDQAGFRFTDICLSLPLKYWDDRCVQPCQAILFLWLIWKVLLCKAVKCLTASVG